MNDEPTDGRLVTDVAALSPWCQPATGHGFFDAWSGKLDQLSRSLLDVAALRSRRRCHGGGGCGHLAYSGSGPMA